MFWLVVKDASNPIYGVTKDSSPPKHGKKANSSEQLRLMTTTTTKDAQCCLFCNRNSHALESCNDLAGKLIEDRLKFMKEKGLCFGCLSDPHEERL